VRQDEIIDAIPQLIVVLDPDGRTVYVNRVALEYTGLSLEQDKLSLDELAHETDYSRAHFLRMFRAATGKTPHQYLTERRIERAKSMLLVAKKISLIDVAARCGFSSQSHLTRVFRKQVGATPTEFKRKPGFKNPV
jgi:PAS domain S-box-containing protein